VDQPTIESLVRSLQAAVETLRPRPPNDFNTRGQIVQMLQNPAVTGVLATLRPLLLSVGETLGSTPEVQAKMTLHPALADSISPDLLHPMDLAIWLYQRCASVSPQQAVEDLNAYLNAAEVECAPMVICGGMLPSIILHLPGGLEWWPWSLVEQDHDLMETVNHSSAMAPFVISNKPRSLFLARRRVLLRWVSGTEATPTSFDLEYGYRRIFETCVCMTALIVSFPTAYPILSWFAPGNSVPFGYSYFDHFRNPRTLRYTVLDGNVLRTFPESLDKLEHFPPERKERFLVPLRRLHSANLQTLTDPVDACVDLRVALETALTIPGRRQIKNNICNNYARYCLREGENPQTLKDEAGFVYAELSKVAHSGRCTSFIEPQDSNVFFAKGLDMMTRVMWKALNDGGLPDW